MRNDITVRPIIFTPHTTTWRRTLEALGSRRGTAADGWQVVDFAAGKVAIHWADPHDELAGHTRLAFEVASVESFVRDRAEVLRAAGGRLELVEAGHGPSLYVHAADSMTLQVDEAADPSVAGPVQGTTVMPLWYTSEVAQAGQVLKALGLEARIASDSGGWLNLAATGSGGSHAAHQADVVAAELSFEHPDVADLARELDRIDIGADVIDESYGRTVRVANPDHPGDLGARIWVNEVQEDLYGYRRLS